VLFTLTSVVGPTRWDEAQIVVQSLESGERKILWEGGSDARYVPTGHLVYAVKDVLFALPFDGDNLEVLGGPVAVIEGVRRGILPQNTTGTANYGFSARGTLVYLSGSTVSNRGILALADRSGVVEPLDVPPNNYSRPRLSPDGSRLVVQTTDNKGSSDIWVYDLSGENQIRQLTFGGNNTRPIWTPDGQRVTFASNRDGKPDIYWQLADGSGVAEQIATAEEETEQWAESWSPDGNTLALVVGRRSGPRGVWMLSYDGETTTPEVFADESESNQSGPAFSPDGRWLAYWSIETGGPQIYVQPFPKTGAKHRVSQQGAAAPLWSPDGQELFYLKLNSRQLMGIDITTDAAFAFGNEQALGIRGFLLSGIDTRPYDITPDGQRFLMVFPADQADPGAETPDEQINIVLNWFEELKERVPVP
jgi:serine/threonine-protein kinase